MSTQPSNCQTSGTSTRTPSLSDAITTPARPQHEGTGHSLMMSHQQMSSMVSTWDLRAPDLSQSYVHSAVPQKPARGPTIAELRRLAGYGDDVPYEGLVAALARMQASASTGAPPGSRTSTAGPSPRVFDNNLPPVSARCRDAPVPWTPHAPAQYESYAHPFHAQLSAAALLTRDPVTGLVKGPMVGNRSRTYTLPPGTSSGPAPSPSARRPTDTATIHNTPQAHPPVPGYYYRYSSAATSRPRLQSPQNSSRSLRQGSNTEDMASKTLAPRLKALPAELRLHIYSHGIAADRVVTIKDERGEPECMSALLASHADIRNEALCEYYRLTRFLHVSVERNNLGKWLLSIQPNHVARIRNLCVLDARITPRLSRGRSDWRRVLSRAMEKLIDGEDIHIRGLRRSACKLELPILPEPVAGNAETRWVQVDDLKNWEKQEMKAGEDELVWFVHRPGAEVAEMAAWVSSLVI
ncbi:hypothetical protein LTR86_001700 [Recurvomyces mirabilis]|nr:hypothetical protein LTR86_001700 [Recurvomyces mirabilis]